MVYNVFSFITHSFYRFTCLTLQQHLVHRTSRRSHRHNISLLLHASFKQKRPICCQHFVHCRFQFFTCKHSSGRNAVSFRYLHIIRILHRGKRIPPVEKHSLPLAHISQKVIVHANNLHGSLLFHNRTQLLNIHLKSAVAHKRAHCPIGTSEGCPDGCGKTEAHRSQSARKIG